MTHTLHRRGDRENLSGDYIVFTMSAKGFNEEGSAEKMKEFLKILLKYHPVNFGDMITGNGYVKSAEEIWRNINTTSIIHAVFTDEVTVSKILQELRARDLGLSVVVTGIHESTEECCQEAGLQKHTVEHSMGIFGDLNRLPEEAVLQLSTMCGHAMVPVNLVLRMVSEIKKERKSFQEAALELTKPCHCGIYNPARAEKLLRRLVPLMTYDS